MTLKARLEGPDALEGGAIVGQVHDALRAAIIRCELTPGSAISQVQLAKQFGISRTPLREVLRLLEREGLVESQHNHRFRVTGFSLDDLVEVYASRIMLEALATRHSMHTMSPAAIAQIKRALDGMAEAANNDDYDGWQAEHRRFHRILNAGGGSRLVLSIEQLTDYVDRYRRIYSSSAPLAWRTGLRQHERILDAARQFDAVATSTQVASHLATAALKIVRAVDADQDVTLIEQALHLSGVGTLRNDSSLTRI